MFEITLEKGKRSVVKTTHSVVVETTKRVTYYSLVDGFGGEDAFIRVTNNVIKFVCGAERYLMAIFKAYPELLKLSFDLED